MTSAQREELLEKEEQAFMTCYRLMARALGIEEIEESNEERASSSTDKQKEIQAENLLNIQRKAFAAAAAVRAYIAGLTSETASITVDLGEGSQTITSAGVLILPGDDEMASLSALGVLWSGFQTGFNASDYRDNWSLELEDITG